MVDFSKRGSFAPNEPPLRTGLIKVDQIEVFKILNGYENIDSNIFFKIKESKVT